MEKTVAFRPFGDRYLVLPDPVKSEEVDLGEIKISTERNGTEAPIEGTVIVKGPNTVFAHHGDKVFFGKYSGYPLVLDGTEYKILREAELLGEKIITPFDEPEIVAPLCLETQCQNPSARGSYFCVQHQVDPL